MCVKKLENILFYDENEVSWLRKLILVITTFYIFTIILFFIFGILEINLQSIIAGIILTFWILFTIFIFKVFHNSTFLNQSFKHIYLPAVFLLAIIEETIIYYNGGGLGGKAKSLEHDLLLAIPVFVGIGIGLYLINLKKRLNPGEFFIIGSIEGFLIEIIFSGNITFILILGGSAMGIYGTMMACFSPKYDNNIKSSRQIIINIINGTLLCFIFVIIGAIVADTIYNIFFG
jgi:hypothetical protein